LSSLEAGLRVAEESTMAEINKLSVEKALNKLRSNDVQKTTKSAKLDDEVRAIEEEVERMRKANARLRRGKRKDVTGRD
jgi:hypothetical protein